MKTPGGSSPGGSFQIYGAVAATRFNGRSG